MLNLKNSRGDTIIEVLIAISIAGLAIGTAYSIAHKALNNAIAARERDQAVGWLENQITALKLRQQIDPSGFSAQFDSANHFCLDTASTGPSDTVHPWGPQKNDNNATNILASPPVGPPTATAPYRAICVQNNLYYLDITTAKDNTTTPLPTINYRLDVRWPRLGGGGKQ